MKKISLLVRWLWQAWPAWITLLLIALNICACRLFHYDRGSVHKVAGAFLQVAGGLFVLWSLNKNMGLFKQGTFGERIFKWWKFRPFRKRRDTTLKISSPVHLHVSGTPTLTQVEKARTLEERIEELEKRIEQYHQEMRTRYHELQKNIGSFKQDIRSDLSEIRKKIAEAESLVAQAIVGGVNWLVFGILLVSYGTLLPIF